MWHRNDLDNVITGINRAPCQTHIQSSQKIFKNRSTRFIRRGLDKMRVHKHPRCNLCLESISSSGSKGNVLEQVQSKQQ